MIAPTGDYDLAHLGWLPRRVGEAIERGHATVIIELDALAFAGSTLLNDVVVCRQLCRASGTELTVTARQPRWHRLFEVGGLGSVLRVPHVPRQGRPRHRA